MKTAIAEISKEALIHNLNLLKKLVGPKVNIMPMLKADAYGHDSILISRIIQQNSKEQISHIGVARLKEALKLKESGVNIPIVLVQGVLNKEDLDLAIINNFEVVIYNHHQLELLNRLKPNTLCKVWVKHDTGMHRLGFIGDDVTDKINKLKKEKKIHSNVFLMSHLSSAAENNSVITEKQNEVFNELAKNWEGPKTLANSAATISIPSTHYDLVRPGIMIYGISPLESKTCKEIGLKPVMTFKAYVLDIKKLKKGDHIGYSAKYCCPKDMQVAVISVGYGDGYPWDNSSSSFVYYKNKYLQVLGAISMDMMVVDCSELNENIQIGNTVELWGKNILVESLAKRYNTIPYELVTQITSRVDRVIV